MSRLQASVLFLATLFPAANPHSILDPPPDRTAKQSLPSKALLDINTATPSQLNALPGMGNAYTQRIIAGRPYTAKNQLTTRGIIPTAAYEKIKDQIIAHRPKP